MIISSILRETHFFHSLKLIRMANTVMRALATGLGFMFSQFLRSCRITETAIKNRFDDK